MKIETQLTFKSYFRYTLNQTYSKFFSLLLVFAGIIGLVGSIMYFLGNRTLYKEPPYIMFGLGLFVIYYPFILYYSAKKYFASNIKLRERIIYEFTDENIRIAGESFNTEMTWNSIFKIVELNQWILIYQSKLTANIIPKSNFGQQLDEFRALVRSKGINAKMQ